MLVGGHCACIFDYVDIFCRPSCSDVGNDCLLEEKPVSGESYEEGCFFFDVGFRWEVVGWYWREV